MKKQINFPTAYGWQDLPLTHDFREVETLPENDRFRNTISPTARERDYATVWAKLDERIT